MGSGVRMNESLGCRLDYNFVIKPIGVFHSEPPRNFRVCTLCYLARLEHRTALIIKC